MEHARNWLTEQGIVQVNENIWTSTFVEKQLTANDVAHEWTSVVLQDPNLDAVGQIRLALGLLDLLNDYHVTSEIRSVLINTHDPIMNNVFWESYRRRLAAPESAQPITYSLWVDWFEDRATTEIAFSEVLGNDVTKLQIAGRLAEMTQNPLHRRVRRVLEVSGPVPWSIKYPAYQAAAALPDLHYALFRGLLASYHDVYGDLEPKQALALLRKLDLPEDTESFAPLRAILKAGHSNHYRAANAWSATTYPTPRPSA